MKTFVIPLETPLRGENHKDVHQQNGYFLSKEFFELQWIQILKFDTFKGGRSLYFGGTLTDLIGCVSIFICK